MARHTHQSSKSMSGQAINGSSERGHYRGQGWRCASYLVIYRHAHKLPHPTSPPTYGQQIKLVWHSIFRKQFINVFLQGELDLVRAIHFQRLPAHPPTTCATCRRDDLSVQIDGCIRIGWPSIHQEACPTKYFAQRSRVALLAGLCAKLLHRGHRREHDPLGQSRPWQESQAAGHSRSQARTST